MALIFNDDSIINIGNNELNTIFYTNQDNCYISLFQSSIGIHSNYYLNNREINNLNFTIKIKRNVELLLPDIYDNTNNNGIVSFQSDDINWINNSYIIPSKGIYSFNYNCATNGISSININGTDHSVKETKGINNLIMKCYNGDVCYFKFTGLMKKIEDNYVTKASVILISNIY